MRADIHKRVCAECTCVCARARTRVHLNEKEENKEQDRVGGGHRYKLSVVLSSKEISTLISFHNTKITFSLLIRLNASVIVCNI